MQKNVIYYIICENYEKGKSILMENIKLKENERIDDLELKGFKIIQNTDGFCFGIDSVLISDFAKHIKKNSKVIDLGTGSGIIATLLCAKTNLSKVIGVEIQEDVAEMANRSIKLNHLENKFQIINDNIKNLKEKFEACSFDVVITNPPYQKLKTGIISDGQKKLISRHEVEADLEDFISMAFYLLKDKGEFYMVHRAERLVDIISIMRRSKIEPKQLRIVCSSQGKEPKLVLIKGIKNARPFLKIKNNLYIYNKDGKYTPEILKIYGKKDK